MRNVIWDVKPRGSCNNRRFGGAYRLCLQGENNQRRCFPPKLRFLHGQHGVTSQKKTFFNPSDIGYNVLISPCRYTGTFIGVPRQSGNRHHRADPPAISLASC
jgi:hypothetical protein